MRQLLRSALCALVVVLGLSSAAIARADEPAAPHRVQMPRHVLRAVARRPKVAIRIAPAAVTTDRPALRASFVDRITGSVRSQESF